MPENGKGRTRNYATVVYPESAPENWQELLVQQFVPAFISPLHDKDENPGGELKKPHHHVMIMFDGVKTVEQAQEVFTAIGGVGCEVVKSIRGYARYLCHLDNPEKVQYKEDEVRCLCGADYFDVINLSVDRRIALTEMQQFCRRYKVTSFSLLADFAMDYRPDWLRVLQDCGSIYFMTYLKALNWTSSSGILSIINPETGEIVTGSNADFSPPEI